MLQCPGKAMEKNRSRDVNVESLSNEQRQFRATKDPRSGRQGPQKHFSQLARRGLCGKPKTQSTCFQGGEGGRVEVFHLGRWMKIKQCKGDEWGALEIAPEGVPVFETTWAVKVRDRGWGRQKRGRNGKGAISFEGKPRKLELGRAEKYVTGEGGDGKPGKRGGNFHPSTTRPDTGTATGVVRKPGPFKTLAGRIEEMTHQGTGTKPGPGARTGPKSGQKKNSGWKRPMGGVRG